MQSKTAAAKPPIYLVESEADQLSNLALSAAARLPNVSELLLAEIDRARVVSPARLPGDVVRMNSQVDFAFEDSNHVQTVTLVLPNEADIEAGRISILTLAGAGLIGMKAGNSIDWPDRQGHTRKITIIAVRPPDAGERHDG